MSVLQFALFFVALLVGYFLLHLRLVRFEEHMQKLAGLRSMDDRLRGIDDRLRLFVDALEKLRLDRIEAGLDRLHEDLEDLGERTTDVRHAVVQIPAMAPVPVASEAEAAALQPPESVGSRIASLVERRLLQLGYGNLNLLTDLSGVRLDHDVEVQVECERGGMPTKGRVIVRNGSVRDVVMQSVSQMFP